MTFQAYLKEPKEPIQFLVLPSVKDDAALDYWVSRFNEYAIDHGEIQERFGKKYLEFEDFDNQRYQLISDEKNQGALQLARLEKI